MAGHKKGLLRNTLTWFAVCMVVLMLMATPLFYWLTKNFYAEDLHKLIETVRSGNPMPGLDLEEDIMEGVMIQFGLVSAVLCVALVLTVMLVSRRVWRPFYDTLDALKGFRLESGVQPKLDDGGVKEFSDLNAALYSLMADCIKSYRVQREFTENASHELQTPLAVFKSKLDVLSQLPGITERQAGIIQDLNQINNRMSRLNRNLLMLAKVESGRFDGTGRVDVVGVVKGLLPYLESLSGGLGLHTDFRVAALPVRANRPLLESLFSNLVVNAVRHNRPGGEIIIRVTASGLTVANTSVGGALDGSRIFDRFYRTANDSKGYGLGLSIVKAVCNYHGWEVKYSFHDGWHEFNVVFA